MLSVEIKINGKVIDRRTAHNIEWLDKDGLCVYRITINGAKQLACIMHNRSDGAIKLATELLGACPDLEEE